MLAGGRVTQVGTALNITGEESTEAAATYTANGLVETGTDGGIIRDSI